MRQSHASQQSPNALAMVRTIVIVKEVMVEQELCLDLLVLADVGLGLILYVVVKCKYGLARVGHPYL